MNIIGIDPSSSKTGVALIKNGKLIRYSCWFKDDKKSHSENLLGLSKFLDKFKGRAKIDFVAVEEMSVSRNMRTVRVVSYFEGLSLYKGAEWGAKTFSFSPSVSRKKAFGKNLSKDQVYAKLKKKLKLLPYDKGGNDESDAICVAMAGWNYIK